MEKEIIQSTLTGIELVSLIASVASLILAVVAIWLAIKFFNMSNEASKATTEAAKGIGASVERLENLFDKLYSDTFTMMKDTVTDMRKHIWNKPSTEDKKEVDDSIKQEIESQIQKVLSDSGISNTATTEELTKKLETSLEEILQKSRNRKRSMKSARVLSTLEDVEPISVSKLANILNMDDDVLAIEHLFSLREKGSVTWEGSKDALSSDTIIRIDRDNEITDEEPRDG